MKPSLVLPLVTLCTTSAHRSRAKPWLVEESEWSALATTATKTGRTP